jgi:HEAT repeat protein
LFPCCALAARRSFVNLSMARNSSAFGWLVVASATCAGSLTAGCSDGPIPELRSLNPWVREQWAADEKEITTYHRRVADLAALRSQAASMPADQQETAAAELSRRLQDERSPVMRAELARTLGAFSVPAAQSAIVAAMADESGQVRLAACKALAHQPTPEGFQALSHAVADDADQDVRIAAARVLHRYKEFETSPALRPALDDNDPALQLAAMQSLKSLTGRTEFGNSVATWREYLDGKDPAPPPGPSLADRWQQLWNWY